MRVKVRHGAMRWKVERADGRPGHVVRTAFRGMIVDIPDDQAMDRLASGACVSEDEELVRTGHVRKLSANASHEELKSWVASANSEEIDEACEAHPKLADRIRDAREQYDAEVQAQNEAMGGLAPHSESDEDDSEPGDEDEGNEDDEGDEDVTDDDLDEVVAGTVSDVSDLLDERQDLAHRVLEAENRRAQENGEDPRKGVVALVQAIIARSAQ